MKIEFNLLDLLSDSLRLLSCWKKRLKSCFLHVFYATFLACLPLCKLYTFCQQDSRAWMPEIKARHGARPEKNTLKGLLNAWESTKKIVQTFGIYLNSKRLEKERETEARHICAGTRWPSAMKWKEAESFINNFWHQSQSICARNNSFFAPLSKTFIFKSNGEKDSIKEYNNDVSLLERRKRKLGCRPHKKDLQIIDDVN